MGKDRGTTKPLGGRIPWHSRPLILGALVFVAYPPCLAANIMSVAALEPPTSQAAASHWPFGWRGFLWVSTLYPVAYVIGAICAFTLSNAGRPQAGRRVAYMPLIYVGLLILYLIAVTALDR
ncbi:MAG: hypothetical protein QM770_08890 [Tepidisphaeraceae bacterium]